MVCSTWALAADPDYLKDKIEGHYVTDLFTRLPMEAIPGTISECKVSYDSPTYVAWGCKVTGAQATVQNGTETKTFTFTKAWISKFSANETTPEFAWYYDLQGEYEEKTSRGAEIKTGSLLSLVTRNGKLLRGQLDLKGLALSGAFVAKLP